MGFLAVYTKKVCFLSLMLLLCGFLVSAQEVSGEVTAPATEAVTEVATKAVTEVATKAVTETVSEQDIVLSDTAQGLRAEESNIAINTDTVAVTPEDTSLGVWFFVRMILVLAVVIALIYFFFAFLKKTTGVGNVSDPYLKKVASLPLGPGKSVHVITLKDKAYIIGAGESSINLIAEVEDKELVDAMNLHAPVFSDKKGSLRFSDLLGKFSTGVPKNDVRKEKKDRVTIQTESSVEFLKNQRNRINESIEDREL